MKLNLTFKLTIHKYLFLSLFLTTTLLILLLTRILICLFTLMSFRFIYYTFYNQDFLKT